MTSKITVIGSINIDYVMQMPRLPKVGETVTDGQFLQTFGGKGANQAVAAARAGGDVNFIAALGNDPVAIQYKKALQADGLDCELLSLEPDVASGNAFIMFDSRGDNYISVAPGSNVRITPDRIEAAFKRIQRSDWIILQQEISSEANQAILKLAAKYSIPVILNYAPANDLSLVPDTSVYGLIVNEVEAQALMVRRFDNSDSAATADAAIQLREKGEHEFVAITLGVRGVTLADKSGTAYLPAFTVKSVDTTAAGDTFCGVLTVGLAEGKSLCDAARFASAASALSVTKIGAQPSIPHRAEIETFLESCEE